MLTSDKKLRDIHTNPDVYRVICEHLDNYPEKEPTTWKTCMGMSVKQLLMFMTEEMFSQDQRKALIEALDAIET